MEYWNIILENVIYNIMVKIARYKNIKTMFPMLYNSIILVTKIVDHSVYTYHYFIYTTYLKYLSSIKKQHYYVV